jgi:hypothetical protein
MSFDEQNGCCKVCDLTALEIGVIFTLETSGAVQFRLDPATGEDTHGASLPNTLTKRIR